MKKIIFLSFMFSLHASQENSTPRIIDMCIMSDALLSGDNNDDIYAFLRWNYKPDNIHLLENDSAAFKMSNGSIIKKPDSFVFEEKKYTPHDMKEAILNGEIVPYPLLWHRKVEGISGTEKLNVGVNATGTYYTLQLPLAIEKNIIRYLGEDVLVSKTSFDFCYDINLKSLLYDPSLSNLIEPFLIEVEPNEALIIPGNTIGIGYFNQNGFLRFVHYCIALGRGVYLFKHDTNSPMSVSTLKSLLMSYNAFTYAVIKCGMKENIDFMSNPFSYIMKPRLIYFAIRMEQENNACSGFFPTQISGFKKRTVVVSKNGIPFNNKKFYRLDSHRKLLYAEGNEQFNVFVIQKDGSSVTLPRLSASFQTKLLRYLMKDSQSVSASDSNNCYFFCLNLCLNCYNDSDLLDESISFAPACEYISEEELQLEDPIALFKSNENGTKTLKHYAVALKSGFYLAKNGNGGDYSVTNMQWMLCSWQCDNFVRIRKDITRYKSFLQNCLNETTF